MLLLAISAVLSTFVLSHNGVVADDCDTKQYPPLTGKTFSYPSQIVSLERVLDRGKQFCQYPNILPTFVQPYKV